MTTTFTCILGHSKQKARTAGRAEGRNKGDFVRHFRPFFIAIALCTAVGCEVSSGDDPTPDASAATETGASSDTGGFPDIPAGLGPQDYELNILPNTTDVTWHGGTNAKYVSICGGLNTLTGKRTLTIAESVREGAGIPECLTYEDRLMIFSSDSNGYTKLLDRDDVVNVLKSVNLMSWDLPYEWTLEISSRTEPEMAPALLDITITSTSAGMSFEFRK